MLNIQRSSRVREYASAGWIRFAVLAVFTQTVIAADGPGKMSPPLTDAERNLALLEEVWQQVNEHFFDPEFRGVDWAGMKNRYADEAGSAESRIELGEVINRMLGELDTSHTRYFCEEEPEYYQLRDIFSGQRIEPEINDAGAVVKNTYTGIGVFTEVIGGRRFITGVIDGAPADLAGLKLGDELLSADGESYRPVLSFKDKSGEEVSIRIRRRVEPMEIMEIRVRPRVIAPNVMFHTAIEASAAVFEREGLRIAYGHIWSYAGDRYHQALRNLVCFGDLRDADALVVDLRGGWGGANASYLNLYNRDIPASTMRHRDGGTRVFDMQWRKPVVLLVNGKTRSGKELLAHGFRAYDIGPVVGERTAGAVTAGRAFDLSDGSLLYLAVADVLVDGERLEGVGVEPDVRVSFDIRYAAGEDPQLERAVDIAAKEVGRVHREAISR